MFMRRRLRGGIFMSAKLLKSSYYSKRPLLNPVESVYPLIQYHIFPV